MWVERIADVSVGLLVLVVSGLAVPFPSVRVSEDVTGFDAVPSPHDVLGVGVIVPGVRVLVVLVPGVSVLDVAVALAPVPDALALGLSVHDVPVDEVPAHGVPVHGIPVPDVPVPFLVVVPFSVASSVPLRMRFLL